MDKYVVNILPTHFLTLFMVVSFCFCHAKVCFWVVKYINIKFIAPGFLVIVKAFSYPQVIENSPMLSFSIKSFIFHSFLIHLEYVLLYGMRDASNFIFFHIIMQLSSAIYLKKKENPPLSYKRFLYVVGCILFSWIVWCSCNSAILF